MRVLKTDFDVSNTNDRGFVVVKLPDDGTPLRLAWQNSSFGQGLKLWFITAREDGELESTDHYFALVVTGQEFIPVKWQYIETIETLDGVLVHVFYVPRETIEDVSSENGSLEERVADGMVEKGERNEKVENTEN